jgi:hypothetical protein
MAQETPSKSAIVATPEEFWRRFTLLDLMILVTGHAIAISFMKCEGLLNISSEEKFCTLDLQGITDLLFLFLILGGGISIVMILSTQFIVRHRCVKLAGGEINTIITILCWIIISILYLVYNRSEIAEIFDYLFMLYICFSGVILFLRLFSKGISAPCC